MTQTPHDSETLAEGQQIITKRADTKKFLPGVHELPGGHIDFDEEPVAGLKREIGEEFGMGLEVGDPFYVFTYTNNIKRSHSIEVIYFAKFLNNLDELNLNPEDHSGYGWFSEDELINATTEHKGLDDVEFVAMRKGFALLSGEALRF